MDYRSLDPAPGQGGQTPEAILDTLRAHPEWDETRRQEMFDRLVAKFDPDRLVEAITPRLRDLGKSDGPAMLRLVEALETPELLEALAKALLGQPGLAADRAWEALALLDEAGVLPAYPELAEWWEDLGEADDDEAVLDQLADQIEDDVEAVWVPLQALGSVEPEVRAEIVSGLGRRPLGPGLIEFLRLLAHSADAQSRAQAIEALTRQTGDDPRLIRAWATIAADHADPAVSAKARRWLGAEADRAIARWAGPGRPTPRIDRVLVTALDGKGRGHVVLLAEEPRAGWTAAVFLCDVMTGVCEVGGRARAEPDEAEEVLDVVASWPDRDFVEGPAARPLALGLLAGSLLLADERTPPVVRFWVERTVGPSFRPAPFSGLLGDFDPASVPFEEWPARARAVLAACPTWADESPLTDEMAEEIALREGDVPPDPARDAALYRYLFEHQLQHRLEPYRRMLIGMASFWQAGGDEELARSALALAWQLTDPGHAVPGHPFVVALTTQSLAAALARRKEKTL